MLKDITSIDGADLGVAQSEAERAGNLLATQIGTLEYAPTAGIDKKFFLESEFRIQNSSFRAYCVQRLLEQRVNVVNVINQIGMLSATNLFAVGTSENNGEMIA